MAETKWHKVKCSKCGKEKMTNPQAYAARLAKFGTEEKMVAEWACRECCGGKPRTKKVAVEKVAPSSRAERQKKANAILRESIQEKFPEAEVVVTDEEVVVEEEF